MPAYWAIYGAAGLALPQIETAIQHLQSKMGGLPFGFNLIHSPGDPNLELETVRLYLKYGIRLISASAFMDLTLPLVYYRLKGVHQNEHGLTLARQKIIAKISREELAKKFLAPAPDKFIQAAPGKRLDHPRGSPFGGNPPHGRRTDGRSRLRRPHGQSTGTGPASHNDLSQRSGDDGI